ncbi:Chromate resistance protein ChrB [Prauserella oleivorans]|uniref:Chromate resistance protein ChrB n=1 Tax=Prauserella oleivorans TaxID=1478153 RepID=A0ABW5W5K0_9PSEU|nr:Chromate resistance protein ChrB [Prauserella flavalba]
MDRVSRRLGQVRYRDRQDRFSVAKLEKEEQSLERLCRWHRGLEIRDLFGAPAVAEAEQRLTACDLQLQDDTERAFRAAHGLDGEAGA